MKAKRFLAVFLSLSLIFSAFTVLNVCAETDNIPYESFQDWSGQGDTYNVKQKALFKPKFEITGQTVGTSDFLNPTDSFVTSDSIYILDSGNERIVVLNKNYTLNRIIRDIHQNENKISLSTSQGICVAKNGDIYIADPEQRKVFITNIDGEIIHIITCPEGSVIPDGLDFMAKKVAVDEDGYIFVLCTGVYYGAMVFNNKYEFTGFFGANKTTQSLLSAFKGFFTGLFETETKLKYSFRTLPYTFENLCEKDGFIYTTTVASDSSSGQVRKLSYSGTNVLSFDEGSAETFSFGMGKTVKLLDKTVVQNSFSGIAVDDSNLMYLLDSTYGKIWVYNNRCDLITVFGGGMGMGEQIGTFKAACDVEINDNEIMVLDKERNLITVFNQTDYGKLYYKALSLHDKGKYDEAFDLWNQILNIDPNNQMSYVGISSYYISIKDYNNALVFSKKAYDRDMYERAFEEVRRDFLSKHFVIISLITILIVSLLIFLFIYLKRHPKAEKDNDIKFVLKSTIHPIEMFGKVKKFGKIDKKRLTRLSIISIIIILLLFVGKVLETTLGGFMYVSYNADTYNSVLVFISTFGIAVLWCVVNWLLCTLFDGKGNFRQIIIVTGISLIPLIINSILYIILSHFLVFSESSALSLINAIAWGVTFILLMVGMSIIHEYSFFRAIGMSIATIIGMFIIAFVLLLVLTLFQDVIEFGRTIYYEAVYRTS